MGPARAKYTRGRGPPIFTPRFHNYVYIDRSQVLRMKFILDYAVGKRIDGVWLFLSQSGDHE